MMAIGSSVAGSNGSFLYSRTLVVSGAGQQRVAVRFGIRHHFSPGIAGGSRAVLDDERPRKTLPQLLGNDARRNVKSASGRRGDDNLHGAVGIIVAGIVLGVREYAGQ